MSIQGNKTALVVQHAAPESLAENFMGVLLNHGFELEFVKVFQSAPDYDRFNPPSLSKVDLLIILGGPFSANDEYQSLKNEREYIKKALDGDVPIFGICLGAQMMAKVLGGIVKPSGGYQFGLRKIYITEVGTVDPVFGKIAIPLVPTLHGECFSIPDGVVKLAEGFMLRRDGTYRKMNMAFRYKDSYGFQFEPQLTLGEFKVWNRELREDYKLMGEDFDPEEEAARNEREFTKYAPQYEAQMKEMFASFLKNAGLI